MCVRRLLFAFDCFVFQNCSCYKNHLSIDPVLMYLLFLL